MQKINIVGWKEGFQKVQMTKVLRAKLGIPLSEAKNITDRILEGAAVFLPVEVAAAAALVDELQALGAMVT